MIYPNISNSRGKVLSSYDRCLLWIIGLITILSDDWVCTKNSNDDRHAKLLLLRENQSTIYISEIFRTAEFSLDRLDYLILASFGMTNIKRRLIMFKFGRYSLSFTGFSLLLCIFSWLYLLNHNDWGTLVKDSRWRPETEKFNSFGDDLLPKLSYSAGGAKLQQFMLFGRENKDEEKMEFIKEMMIHAWKGYEKYAWGADELQPVSLSGKFWYNNSSLMSTPVDSLDTLWIMGLMDEYNRAKDMILENLDFDKIDRFVNVFETTIRILGGLLSAYDLEGDKKILKKASDLADKLLPCFETKSGIPVNFLNLKTGKFDSNSFNDYDSRATLAQAGSLQLEFQYLSDVSGNPIYSEKSLFALEQLVAAKKPLKGLYPLSIKQDALIFYEEEYSIGGGGDSFYEYLLKLWLSTGEERYWDLYEEAADAISEHLVKVSEAGIVYVPASRRVMGANSYWYREKTFQHLSCFVGGMLTTGALARKKGNWTEHLDIGVKITESCYRSYTKTSTGIGPDAADEFGNPWTFTFHLRPEVIESIFYLWRYTHDPIYREWGWQIAKSINKWCRLPSGFSGLLSVESFNEGFNSKTGEPMWPPDVNSWEEFNAKFSYPHNLVKSSAKYPYVDAITRLDVQESYFLAETLKYLYLLFSSDDTIPLEKYVFNTEAHVLSVRGHGRRSFPKEWSYLPLPKNLVSKYNKFGPVGLRRSFSLIDLDVGSVKS
ncbi:Mannosyl-oligosaccharide 1,2-alpha-mannosidase IB [Nowakowskiella sp. JEL0078]|nr:Mannosyl-oligosaccharide 1,2-alpha-mannosidase IB [Nowakowskiella sp. JEL0078]